MVFTSLLQKKYYIRNILKKFLFDFSWFIVVFLCKSKSKIVSLIGQKNTDQTEFFVMRPNSGLQFFSVSLDCVKKLKKISSDEAKPIWTDYYQSSKDYCMHVHMSVIWILDLKNLSAYCKFISTSFFFQVWSLPAKRCQILL